MVIAGLLIAGAVGVAQQRRQQDIDLQAAIRTETVQGDLNGAIKQYSTIVSKYKSDRAAVAMALVHMADCYRKMGDAESKKLYEQVVKEYGDQKQAVALARAALGGGSQARRQTNALVWSGNNTYIDGTMSLDGSLFSYVDWDTGDVAVREMPTGTERRLTQTGNTGTSWKGFADDTAISKDGKQIAFSWWEETTKRFELRVLNVAGEPNPRRLYSNTEFDWVEPRDWSPDGKWIAALLSRPDRTAAIGLVSVTDGSIRPLQTGFRTRHLQGYPRVFFSPDGRRLGYDLPETNTTQLRDLYIYDIGASREIPIATRRGQDIMLGWSSDGKRLLFGSDRSGSLGLWAQMLDNGKPMGAPELLKPDLGSVEPLGVTQSGALYYGVVTGSPASSVQIGSIDFSTGRVTSVRDVSENYLESNSSPIWSPDGRQFAYLSRRGSGYRAVTVIAIRSSDTNQLIRELPIRTMSLNGWAPDGQSLLGGGFHMGRSGAFRIDAHTGAVTPLVVDPPNQATVQAAVWSPDGKSIYYSRSFKQGEEYAFFRRDIASDTETELIRRPRLGALNLSPDGKFLATPTVEPSSNSRVLLLIPTDGGEAREVIRVPSEVGPADLKTPTKGQTVAAPVWAADSRSLIFRKRRSPADETHEQWLYSLDGGVPRKLDAPAESTRGFFNIHPDGKRIFLLTAVPRVPQQNQVWVLENFLPASK